MLVDIGGEAIGPGWYWAKLVVEFCPTQEQFTLPDDLKLMGDDDVPWSVDQHYSFYNAQLSNGVFRTPLWRVLDQLQHSIAPPETFRDVVPITLHRRRQTQSP